MNIMFVGVQVPLRVPNARIAQLVEHDLAKVGVAGSSPVSRSSKRLHKNVWPFYFWLSWLSAIRQATDRGRSDVREFALQKKASHFCEAFFIALSSVGEAFDMDGSKRMNVDFSR